MPKKRYYKATVLIEVEEDMDASCDEVFSVINKVQTGDVQPISYEKVTKREFVENYHNLLTPEGGI